MEDSQMRVKQPNYFTDVNIGRISSNEYSTFGKVADKLFDCFAIAVCASSLMAMLYWVAM